MKMVTKAVIAVGAFAAALSSVPASAQDGRLSLSFIPAVVTGSGDSNLALAGSAGYRFTEHFSFEGELTWIDDAAAGGFRNRIFDNDPRVTAASSVINSLIGIGQPNNGQPNTGRGNNQQPSFIDRGGLGIITGAFLTPDTRLASTDGQTWIGTMGVRYEPVSQTARFKPYVSGGLGVNFTDQNFSLAATSATQAISESASHSGLAFSAGGGANIHLGGALWVAADAKYFHLSQNRDLMRLGGGVTFKF